MITFLYDGVRMPGNIGTMIRNGDLLISNYQGKIRHIILSPINDNKISWIKIIIINIVSWICDIFDINKRISIDNNFGINGKFNYKAKRTIKRFACISKNGSYSEIIFDPSDLNSLIENNVVFIFDNINNSKNINDLKSILLQYSSDTNYTFIIGSESNGVSERFISRYNHVLSISTRKNISINVSNAQGILCYELNNSFI